MTTVVLANKSFRRWANVPLLARYEGLPLASTLATIGIIAVALSLHLVVYIGDLNDLVCFALILWSCGVVAGRLQMTSIEACLKCLAFVFLSGITNPLASAALAVVSLPIADSYFLSLDRLIFGSSVWPDIIHGYHDHIYMLKILSYVYVSLGWQPFFLVIALCICQRTKMCWIFTAAWTSSLFLCTSIFPLCPGVGAYRYLGVAFSEVPEILVRSAWHYPTTLLSFKTGISHNLDIHSLDGIIAMPSFHACASVLLGWGYWHTRFLRVPFAILNIAMWVSSVPIGGHYVVDVIAGSAVAIITIYIGSRLASKSQLYWDN